MIHPSIEHNQLAKAAANKGGPCGLLCGGGPRTTATGSAAAMFSGPNAVCGQDQLLTAETAAATVVMRFVWEQPGQDLNVAKDLTRRKGSMSHAPILSMVSAMASAISCIVIWSEALQILMMSGSWCSVQEF